MPVNVRSGDRDQLMLMPPSMADWLPKDHLAWFLIDVVDELDVSSFYSSYREDGRGGATYDPAMMLVVLLYAYCTGERSSRKMERRLHEDVAYRVVAANQQPDHATLARFRRRHEQAIAELFTQVLGLCVQAGLVNAGLVAIDGTKIGADASYFTNKTRQELAEEILAEAEATDAAEDERLGETRGDELPKEWRHTRDRRARIKEALRQLDAQGARDYEGRMKERADKEAALGHKLTGPKLKPTPARRRHTRKANTTDPDSRVMAVQTRGPLQGYNAQAAATVDHIIVAADVTNIPNDQISFVPMARAVAETLKEAGHAGGAEVLVADAGYWSAANATTDVGADVLIATRKSPWRRSEAPSDERLAVLARVNRGELSQRAAGEILGVSYTWVRDMTKRYFSESGTRITPHADPEPDEWIPVIERLAREEISQRAAIDQLCVSSARVKTMFAHVRGEGTEPTIARRAMDKKLGTRENAERYKKRKVMIEPVFGNIKANHKFRRFTGRGLTAVQSEWKLACAAHNLLKLRSASLAG
jgi:transposase